MLIKPSATQLLSARNIVKFILVATTLSLSFGTFISSAPKIKAAGIVYVGPGCNLKEKNINTVNYYRGHHSGSSGNQGYAVDMGANGKNAVTDNNRVLPYQSCLGTDAIASISGKVGYMDILCNGTYDRILTITRADGIKVKYNHLSARAVAIGSFVSGGQKIGTLGKTGCADGVHLHLEVYQNNVKLSYHSNTDGSNKSEQWRFQTPNNVLYFINRADAGSNSTAVHVLNGDSNFQSFVLQTGTALGKTGNDNKWAFTSGDYNNDGIVDLYAISKQDAGSNSTAVHVLNGATNFQSFLLQTGTILHQTGNDDSWAFATGDYNSDGKVDIYAISKRDGGSNSTAVHVLNGASNYQNFLLNTGSILHQTGSDSRWMFGIADYNLDGKLDLYAIDRMDAGSNSTAVHVLNGANNFQNFLLNTGSSLGKTGSTDSWAFVVGKFNTDSKPDVYAINKNDAGSNSTAVHVLNGASNYQNFLLQTGTAIGKTGTNDLWKFSR